MIGSRAARRAVSWRPAAHRPPPASDQPGDSAVLWSDRGVTFVCWATSIAALAGSYRGLFDFATQRGQIPGWAALAFPLYLDAFLVVGELRLFSAARRGEDLRIKAWSWLLTVAGLLASLAGNIAHAGPGASLAAKLAAAAAPLAAAVSLGTGLGIAKLRARQRRAGTAGTERRKAAAPPDQPADGTPARQPGTGRRRGRRPGGPPSWRVAAWIEEDRLAGLDMSRRQFAGRHGLTEHAARVALSAGSNGAGG